MCCARLSLPCRAPPTAQPFPRAAQYVVQTGALGGHNLRATPTLRGAVVGHLAAGTVVAPIDIIVEHGSNNVWVQLAHEAGAAVWTLAQAATRRYLLPFAEPAPAEVPASVPEHDLPEHLAEPADTAKQDAAEYEAAVRAVHARYRADSTSAAACLADMAHVYDRHPAKAAQVDRDATLRSIARDASQACGTLSTTELKHVVFAVERLHHLNRSLRNASLSPAAAPGLHSNTLMLLLDMRRCMEAALVELYGKAEHRAACTVDDAVQALMVLSQLGAADPSLVDEIALHVDSLLAPDASDETLTGAMSALHAVAVIATKVPGSCHVPRHSQRRSTIRGRRTRPWWRRSARA